MRTIYVNLDRSADRRDWMELQARELGITLERFSAVDGKSLDKNPFPSVPVGAAGCFLSHCGIWGEIAAGSDRYVLVLEDDAHMSRDLPKFLADNSWIPVDADIVHIERSQKYCRVMGRSAPALGRKLFRAVGENTGTNAYIISKSCAQRLVNDFTSINVEFDQILFNGGRPDLTIYKLSPALSIQDKLTKNPRFDILITRVGSEKQHIDVWKRFQRETGRIFQQIAEALRLTKSRRIRVDFV